MIDKAEVKKIAKLARLAITEKEEEKMQKDLSAILDYFGLLKKAPKPESAKQEASLQNNAGQMRNDEEKPREAGLADKLIAAAPEKKDGYIKVKAVF